MPIFDSDKRPRGLRTPFLTALKSGNAASKSQFSFHSKKSTDSLPHDESIPPARPPPPPSKALPPPPPSELPGDVPRLPPKPASMNSPSSMNTRRPDARINPPLSEGAPRPGRRTDPPAIGTPPQQPAPATLAPAGAANRESVTPLEDFIPTPETVTPLEEQRGTPFTPPEAPAVAAPLNKVHFACFQEHRNMPVAQNVWYPVPCMTCHKHDTEIRHRCVFCCLRICQNCFQNLQKCQNRSLGELMARIR